MRVLLFVLAALALTSALDLDHEWATFKKVYNKQYMDAEEERYRCGSPTYTCTSLTTEQQQQPTNQPTNQPTKQTTTK